MEVTLDVELQKRGMISEITRRGETPVRLAVYDSKGSFLGYKIDSEWDLDINSFKAHSLECRVPPDRLVRNLVFMENRGLGMVTPFSIRERWGSEDTSFRVIVEQVDAGGELVKELMTYKVYKEGEKYKSEGPITN